MAGGWRVRRTGVGGAGAGSGTGGQSMVSHRRAARALGRPGEANIRYIYLFYVNYLFYCLIMLDIEIFGDVFDSISG